ncbi:hypothetical protein U1Q18_052625 [Sarracenia purpurea var. burkii]
MILSFSYERWLTLLFLLSYENNNPDNTGKAIAEE